MPYRDFGVQCSILVSPIPIVPALTNAHTSHGPNHDEQLVVVTPQRHEALTAVSISEPAASDAVVVKTDPDPDEHCETRFDAEGRRSVRCKNCKEWIKTGPGNRNHALKNHTGSAVCISNQKKAIREQASAGTWHFSEDQETRFNDDGRRFVKCKACTDWINMGLGMGNHALATHQGSAACRANKERFIRVEADEAARSAFGNCKKYGVPNDWRNRPDLFSVSVMSPSSQQSPGAG